MTHPLTFARRTPTEVRRQVVDAQSSIIDATSEAPRLFRAPAGVWSPTVLRTAAGNGMVPIDWNVDPRDWSRPGTAHIVRQMLAMRPGDIVLCHDGGGNRQETVQALGTVLPILLDRGLTFVPL
jgi:peptidoglycan/xylan/chitin deacetylase (PgdA/CDA1 family)